jgi:hypothetical protein
VPGLELPHHQGVGQQIEVPPGRGRIDPERLGRLRRIPDLRVVVRQHRPETQEGGGRDAHAPLGKIAFEQRLDELLPPGEAVRFAARQPREREAAAAPRLLRHLGPELGQREAADFDALLATRQALRALPQQIAPRRFRESGIGPDARDGRRAPGGLKRGRGGAGLRR